MMNANTNWQDLTIPEFVGIHCRQPLNKALRTVVNFPGRLLRPDMNMRELTCEADVLRLPRVGVKSGAEIVRAMRRLGWTPGKEGKPLTPAA